MQNFHSKILERTISALRWRQEGQVRVYFHTRKDAKVYGWEVIDLPSSSLVPRAVLSRRMTVLVGRQIVPRIIVSGREAVLIRGRGVRSGGAIIFGRVVSSGQLVLSRRRPVLLNRRAVLSK